MEIDISLHKQVMTGCYAPEDGPSFLLRIQDEEYCVDDVNGNVKDIDSSGQ